ncbi:MAG: arginase family protein [archaeon]|nr:arginase family protein [Nanoarchaeota archaeon]
MKLIYDSEYFLPILNKLMKEEINEDEIEIRYKPVPKDKILINDPDKKKVFLSSGFAEAYKHIKGFTTDKRDPGIIFISNRAYLRKHELLNKLLIDQTFKPSNIILLGQHSWSKEEKDFIAHNRINSFSMQEISQEGYFEISEAIMNNAKTFSDLYIFIDSNIIDYPIIRSSWVGGLSTRELIFFVQRLKRVANFDTAELVIDPVDARIAVKLLSELYVE